MPREILHVDVNNAFLSWTATEMLKNGEKVDIRTIPSVIGGDESQRHGIVLAKSMPAKKIGIKTGDPLYLVRQKCPNIQIYSGNFKIYKKYSDMLYNLLSEYSFKIERYSIDECFVDMTEFLLGRKLIDIAYEISKRVREELGFTVNIGVAHNKLLAKMASDFTKPNRVHTLYESEIPYKMWNLPISELFMVGRKTVPKLERMNIKRIKDLVEADPKLIISKFGKAGSQMLDYAKGIDSSEVNYKRELPKGIGNSVTVSQDIRTLEKINEVLVSLVEHTTYRLRQYKMLGTVVSVQLRNNEFKDYSHQQKVMVPTNSTKEILKIAQNLVKEIYKGEPIRLIGVRIDKLVKESEKQLSIFDMEIFSNENNKSLEKLDKTVDSIKNKYGYGIISRASDMKINNKIERKD